MSCVKEAFAIGAGLSWERLRRRSERSGNGAHAIPSDGVRAMSLHPDHSRWKALEREAHRPEVQDLIRQEIRNGAIRVVPDLKGGIRIIPTVPEQKAPPPRGGPDALPRARHSRSAGALPLPRSVPLVPGSTGSPFSPRALVRAANGR